MKARDVPCNPIPPPLSGQVAPFFKKAIFGRLTSISFPIYTQHPHSQNIFKKPSFCPSVENHVPAERRFPENIL